MAHRFNPAPGWPQPPQGWTPPAGWRPDPSWPPAPEGWQFWIDDATGAPAEAPGSAGVGSAERPGPASTEGQPSAPAPQHLGPSAAAAAAAGPSAAAFDPADQAGQSVPTDQAHGHQVHGEQPHGQQAQQGTGDQPTEHVPQEQAPSFGQDQPTEHLPQEHVAPYDQPTQQFGAAQPFSGAPTQEFGGGTGQPGQAGQPGQSDAGGYGGAGAGFDYAGVQQDQGTSPYEGQQPQPYQQYRGQQPQQQYPGQQPQQQYPGQQPQYADQPQYAGQPQYSGQPYPAQQYPAYAASAGGPGGPGPKKKRTGLIVTIIVIIAIVLAGIVWGIVALLSGDDTPEEPTAAPTQTQQAPSADPSPTADPTTDPEPDPTTAEAPDPGTAGDVVELAPGEPATVSSLGTAIAELTITEIETGWMPDSSNFLCSEPDDGTEYALLHVEVNTNGDVDPAGYIFTGMEFSTLGADGSEQGANMTFQGLMCLGDEQTLPSEWQANESYSGLVLASFTPETAFVQYHDFLDFRGESPSYRWRVADFFG